MTERATRSIVKERSLNCCEVCGRHNAVHMHHRVNRSQGGRWTPGNILHLCVQCHHRITVNPSWSKAQGYTVPGTYEPCDIPIVRWSRWTGAAEVVLLHDDGTYEHTERSPGLAA